jgi:ATP-dependent Lhr-like helicase
VANLLHDPPPPTVALHAQASQLLERQGVVTREGVLAEGVPGGFTSVYGVLKVLEERGTVRRGYFVAGLGAAQFALPGAVDRLRGVREAADDAPAMVLAATDPAQPYGAALPWPDTEGGRPARVAGALCVLAGSGALAAWYDERGRHLVTFEAARADLVWLDALVRLVKDGRRRELEVRKVDGEGVSGAGLADALRAAGFVDGYKGLVLRG